MPDNTESVTIPLDVVRAFADAYARSDIPMLARFLHPEVRERAILAGGAESVMYGRDALVAEARDFFAPYEQVQVRHQDVGQVGPFFRWSVQFRLQKGDEIDIYEWHAFVTVENGYITKLDAVCTGRLQDSSAG